MTNGQHKRSHTIPLCTSIDLISYLGLSTSYVNDSANIHTKTHMHNRTVNCCSFSCRQVFISRCTEYCSDEFQLILWPCVSSLFSFSFIVFIFCTHQFFFSFCNGHVYLLRQREPHSTIKVQFSKTQLFISIALPATSKS